VRAVTQAGAQDKAAGDDKDDAHDKFPFKDMGAVAKNRRLTPLQAKLAAKLEAAHFRMLNEELYTTPSSAAVLLSPPFPPPPPPATALLLAKSSEEARVQTGEAGEAGSRAISGLGWGGRAGIRRARAGSRALSQA
jgi:hypothetical protein